MKLALVGRRISKIDMPPPAVNTKLMGVRMGCSAGTPHYPHFCIWHLKQAQLIERSGESKGYGGDWNAAPVFDTYIYYKDLTFHTTRVESTFNPPLPK